MKFEDVMKYIEENKDEYFEKLLADNELKLSLKRGMKMDQDNTIMIHGNSLEALGDGTILINNKQPENKEDLEKALNILIKATIAIVRGY